MSYQSAESKSGETVSVKRGRSPAYPAVSLEKAIELARRVYDSQRKQEAHVESVFRALGYSGPSGPSLRALSALKQHGLTQDLNEGKNRKIRLTETALDLVLLPESDPRRFASLSVAALAPAIYSALWDRYGAVLPDDAAILAYLVRDRGYHEKAAQDIVENYRATFAIAELNKKAVDTSDKAPGGGRREDTSPLSDTFAPIGNDPAIQELPILVGPGKVARIPFPMTEEDFELFIGTLNLWKKKLVRPSLPAVPVHQWIQDVTGVQVVEKKTHV